MQTFYVTPVDLVQPVLDAATEGSLIAFAPGVYREKLTVSTRGLTLFSQTGRCEDVILTNGDYANKIHPLDGKEFNTFRTYTVLVAAPDVTFRAITVENSAGDPQEKGQSVALSVYQNNFFADRCAFCSTQDTLFLGPLPDDLVVRYDGFLRDEARYYEGEALMRFQNCRVEGSVDFIFGCANAWFYNCEIVSVPDGRETGFVAAPAHSLKQKNGFCFVSCAFTHSGCEKESVYLARPWRDFGKAAFINCDFGEHIRAEAFDKWNDTERNRTARFFLGGSSALPGAVSWSKRLSKLQVQELTEVCEALFQP